MVVITGASSGIGAELAHQLAREGARLALSARRIDELERVAGICREAGAEAIVVPGDVSIESDCRMLIEKTVQHFGSIDILVNNAGIGSSAAFETITDLSIFDTLMRVNYLGSVWCTAFALPHLRKSRGSIVAISSLTGLAGVPRRTAYAATKHAMAGFFDSLRIELEGTGVNVTVIYPGFVLTDINRHALSGDGTPYGDRAYKRRPGESMSVEKCCQLIVRSIRKRDRELVMTWRGKVGRVLKLISPRLVDIVARRAIGTRQ